MTWRQQANCIGLPPKVLWPENWRGEHPALTYCRSCEVTAECLADALGWTEQLGVRGGYTAAERRAMLGGAKPDMRGRRVGWMPTDSRVWALADDIAARFGVDTEDLFGPGRRRATARARRWLWWKMNADGDSHLRIGRLTGFESTSVGRSIREAELQIRRGVVPDEVADLVEAS